MAFTQSNLDAVEAAIASGELTVRHNGREVTYRSMADLMSARQVIRQSLANQANPAAPTFGGRSYGLASFNNGGCER